MEREEEKKERKREGEVPKHEDAHLLLDRVQVHLPHEGDSAAADQHGAGAEQGLAPSRAEVKDTDGTRRRAGQKWGFCLSRRGPGVQLALRLWGLLDNSCLCGNVC